MYNKYRTQFEVIHALEKEISIPKPLIAQLKHKLRHEIALEEMRRFQGGHCVKDFGDGSVILLLPIIGTYFDTSLDEATRIFEDNYEMRCANSPYDCTGQMFTVWYKLVKRQGMWYAYHYIGCDC
jgi:hypothetical protein